MSIKSIKEKQLLVNLAKSFGQEVDNTILEDVKKHKQLENSIKESVRDNFLNDLLQVKIPDKPKLEFPQPPSLEEVLALFPEEENVLVSPQEPEDTSKHIEQKETREPDPTLAERAAKSIAITEQNSFRQPDPIIVPQDLGAIQNKLKFLEQWLGKISAHGPGGGASDTSNFTNFVKLIDVPVYNVARKDHYLGVNYAGPVTINMPSGYIEPGRMVIIKDESGNCSANPISVVGNIDNDPNGFILQIDNGGIQMIYREGWRIV